MENSAKLNYLECANNQLPILNVYQNPALQSLFCSGNQLDILDLSANESLSFLSCGDNERSELTIHPNAKFIRFSCNDLSSISNLAGYVEQDIEVLIAMDISEKQSGLRGLERCENTVESHWGTSIFR